MVSMLSEEKNYEDIREKKMKSVSWEVVEPEVMKKKEFVLPEIGPRDLLMKVNMVSICGSDLKIYKGKIANTTLPIILGHEMVGTVADIGEKASEIYNVSKGDRITVEPYITCGHCKYCLSGYYQLCKFRRCYGVSISSSIYPHIWGAYGEYMFVAPGSFVYKLEDGISDEAGCYSSILGNGFRFITTKAGLKPQEDVLIIGPGAIGIATVIAAKESGAGKIIVAGLSGKDELKFTLATKFGADYIIRVDKEDLVSRVEEITDREMVDVAVECSGALSIVEQGLSSLKPLGRFVIAGLNGNQKVPITTDKFERNELTVMGSLGQSGNVQTAMKIINKNKYNLKSIVTHRFSLDEADKAINYFMEGHPECIRVSIKID